MVAAGETRMKRKIATAHAPTNSRHFFFLRLNELRAKNMRGFLRSEFKLRPSFAQRFLSSYGFRGTDISKTSLFAFAGPSHVLFFMQCPVLFWLTRQTSLLKRPVECRKKKRSPCLRRVCEPCVLVMWFVRVVVCGCPLRSNHRKIFNTLNYSF